MSGKGGGNLARFAELIQQMAHEAQILSLPELIDHVVHHSGLLAHYQNDREGADRLETLTDLVNADAALLDEENFEGIPAGRLPDAAMAGPDRKTVVLEKEGSVRVDLRWNH